MGIGGGFLMTIWDNKTQKAYFLNAREYAPAAATETIFTSKNKEEASKGNLFSLFLILSWNIIIIHLREQEMVGTRK